MRILIIGSGLAGLTLASFLEKAGIDYTLIERQRSWKTKGYVLTLWDTGIDVLKHLGLFPDLEVKGYRIPNIVVKDKDGNILYKEPRSSVGLAYEIERDALHSILRKGLTKSRIRMGKTVRSLKQGKKKVSATFSDNTKDKYDMVVGADGSESDTRRWVEPRRKNEYTGFTFWYYWVKKGVFRFPKDSVSYFDEAKAFVLFPSKNTRHLAAYFTMPAKHHSTDDLKQSMDLLKERFSSFGDVIPSVLNNLMKETHSIYHHDDDEALLKRWYLGRIVLLGDAVHVNSPVTGLGASLAMEDAEVLFGEVLKHDDLEEAFESYSRKRYPKARYVRRISRTIHRGMRMNKKNWIFKSKKVSNWFVRRYYKRFSKVLAWKP